MIKLAQILSEIRIIKIPPAEVIDDLLKDLYMFPEDEEWRKISDEYHVGPGIGMSRYLMLTDKNKNKLYQDLINALKKLNSINEL